jgi:hypothetical protein
VAVACLAVAAAGGTGYLALRSGAGRPVPNGSWVAGGASGPASAPASASPASPSPGPSTSSSPSATPAGSRLLFGLGPEADGAAKAALVRQAPVGMLTSWYNGPNDLGWMSGWRSGTVRQAYAAGLALHLIVYAADPEVTLSTPHGPSCGRGYPLSGRFTSDMATLAKTFAGTKTGPPLYVTLFTEFQAYPCKDNGWSADTDATNYYLTLKDQYRSAYALFHQYAPNARVSLGWGGWQAGFDDPAHGGGRSMFAHFEDIMRMSEFQSFQAMDAKSNTSGIRAMVKALGGYGPVMLAHFQNDSGGYDADVHAILTDSFVKDVTTGGLFAMSFMDDKRLSASASTFQFVKAAVQRYGRRA